MKNYLFLIIVLVVLLVGVGVLTFVDFKLTDAQYDRIRNITLKWPGITTLLGVIVSTFSIPYGEETITIVSAVGAFMAYVLGISSKVYDAATEARSERYERENF